MPLLYDSTMRVIFVIAIITTFVSAVPDLQKCGGSVKLPADDDVTISKCEEVPCVLKRGTDVKIGFKVTPEADVSQVTNTVYAVIGGIPLPFIGVDNTDACNNIYNAAGEKVGCPLKAGQEYLYKNSFKILPIYPKLSFEVHWALTGPRKKDIFCFEVPAKIV